MCSFKHDIMLLLSHDIVMAKLLKSDSRATLKVDNFKSVNQYLLDQKALTAAMFWLAFGLAFWWFHFYDTAQAFPVGIPMSIRWDLHAYGLLTGLWAPY